MFRIKEKQSYQFLTFLRNRLNFCLKKVKSKEAKLIYQKNTFKRVGLNFHFAILKSWVRSV